MPWSISPPPAGPTGVHEISIQVSYRRTAEQIQAVVNATSTEALSALLEAALDEGRTELAVRVGYWGEDGQARVEETVAQLREARGLAETPPWTISYYPGGVSARPRASRSCATVSSTRAWPSSPQ